MRIAIELRADVSPDIMLNNLFKHTQMQVNFGASCWHWSTDIRAS